MARLTLDEKAVRLLAEGSAPRGPGPAETGSQGETDALGRQWALHGRFVVRDRKHARRSGRTGCYLRLIGR